MAGVGVTAGGGDLAWPGLVFIFIIEWSLSLECEQGAVRIIRQKGSHFYHYRSECDPVTIVSSRYLTQLPGLYLYLAVKTEHQTMIGCRMPLFILSSSALRNQSEKLRNRPDRLLYTFMIFQ